MNRTQATLPMLQAHPLFQGLEAAQLQSLAASSLPLHVPAGTHLLLPGAGATSVYLVRQGWLKLYRLTENGEETVTCLLGPGDAALADLLFYPYPAAVGAQTESAAELLQIPAVALRRVLAASPQLGLNLLQTLAGQMQKLMHQVEQLKTRPAVERIAGFLLRTMLDESGHPQREAHLPFEKSKIAGYLGLTPETFSRSLKDLAARGITVKGRQVLLEDLHGLCSNCDPTLAPACTQAGGHPACRRLVG